ncbi:UDP-glucose 6-dehydrogenase, partial [Acinetobacter variabilis]
MNKSICVVGLGYVGLSNAILLSQRNNVIAIDTDKHRIDLINQKKSPIQDVEINSYLKDHNLNLTATAD